MQINVERTIHRDKSDTDSVSDRLIMERERERMKRLGLDASTATQDQDRGVNVHEQHGGVGVQDLEYGTPFDLDLAEVKKLGSEGSASSLDGDGESEKANGRVDVPRVRIQEVSVPDQNFEMGQESAERDVERGGRSGFFGFGRS